MADLQAERVYAAEYRWRDVLELSPGLHRTRLASDSDVLAFVARVESDTRFQTRYYRHKPLAVRRSEERTGTAIYNQFGHEIFIPLGWAGYEDVVLHELAHAVALGDGHGPRFLREYRWLVFHFLGNLYEYELGRALTKSNAYAVQVPEFVV